MITKRMRMYTRRISELVNQLREIRRRREHVERENHVLTLTLQAQRRTLYEMNLRAERRNREIAVLQAKLNTANHTVTSPPTFSIGDSDADSR